MEVEEEEERETSVGTRSRSEEKNENIEETEHLEEERKGGKGRREEGTTGCMAMNE